MDPIPLPVQDIAAGMTFTNQIRIAEAQLHAAMQAERDFIEYMRVHHGAPEGWTILDWAIGLVPAPEEQHTHG